MIKFIIAIMTCVSLYGCMYQTVDQYDINRALVVCKNTENIASISANFAGDEYVTCYSGESELLGRVKGAKK